MRILASFVVAIVVIAVAAAVYVFWPVGLPDVAAARDRLAKSGDSIARGEYLVRAADCEACHTVPGQPRFSGGVALQLPFGAVYGTNLTPDKETGIGDWSDAEFVRALHSGVSKDGHNLYPAFPYAAYALTSDEDALAIKDYLFSLPAAHQPNKPTRLPFPYDQRWLVSAWNALFKPRAPFTPDPNRPPQWNRGFYLSEALGHCGECHTPRNMLYGLDRGRKFAGAVTGGWKAYNITPDPHSGLGDWSDAQIASYLSQGHAQDRGVASGTMAEAVSYSLHYLKPEDISAIVAYLRSVPPIATPGEPAPPPAPQALQASTLLTPSKQEQQNPGQGQRLFESACASCHAWNGGGVELPQAALRGDQSVNDPDGTNLLQVLLHGSRLETGKGVAAMPAFGLAYTDQELADLANYVIVHFSGRSGAVTPAKVAAARAGG